MDFDDDDDVVAEEDFLGGLGSPGRVRVQRRRHHTPPRPRPRDFPPIARVDDARARTPPPPPRASPPRRPRPSRTRAPRRPPIRRRRLTSSTPPPDGRGRVRRGRRDPGARTKTWVVQGKRSSSNAGSGSANGARRGRGRGRRVERRLWIRRVRRVGQVLRPEPPNPFGPTFGTPGSHASAGTPSRAPPNRDAPFATTFQTTTPFSATFRAGVTAPVYQRSGRRTTSETTTTTKSETAASHRATATIRRGMETYRSTPGNLRRGWRGTIAARGARRRGVRRPRGAAREENRTGRQQAPAGRGLGRRRPAFAPMSSPTPSPTPSPMSSPTPSPTPSPMSSPTPSPTPSSGAGAGAFTFTFTPPPPAGGGRLRRGVCFFRRCGGVRAGVPRRRVRANASRKKHPRKTPSKEKIRSSARKCRTGTNGGGRERLWGGAPAGVVPGRFPTASSSAPSPSRESASSRPVRRARSTPAFAGGFERRRGRARGRVERRTRDNAPGG